MKENTTMSIEAGKRYILRNGVITTPLQKSRASKYPWMINGVSWDSEGSFFHHSNDEHPLDIVAEYIAPTPTIPSIPEGWRVVRYGHAEVGEWYLDPYASCLQVSKHTTTGKYPIIERIEPIKPPLQPTNQQLFEMIANLRDQMDKLAKRVFGDPVNP